MEALQLISGECTCNTHVHACTIHVSYVHVSYSLHDLSISRSFTCMVFNLVPIFFQLHVNFEFMRG